MSNRTVACLVSLGLVLALSAAAGGGEPEKGEVPAPAETGAGTVLLSAMSAETAPGAEKIGQGDSVRWKGVAILGSFQVAEGELRCLNASRGELLEIASDETRQALQKIALEKGPQPALFHGSVTKVWVEVVAPGLPGHPGPHARAPRYRAAIERAEILTPAKAEEIGRPLFKSAVSLEQFVRGVTPLEAGAVKYYIPWARFETQQIMDPAHPHSPAYMLRVPSVELDVRVFNGTDRPVDLQPPAEIAAAASDLRGSLKRIGAQGPDALIRVEPHEVVGDATWHFIVPEALRAEKALSLRIPLAGPAGETAEHKVEIAREE